MVNLDEKKKCKSLMGSNTMDKSVSRCPIYAVLRQFIPIDNSSREEGVCEVYRVCPINLELFVMSSSCSVDLWWDVRLGDVQRGMMDFIQAG